MSGFEKIKKWLAVRFRIVLMSHRDFEQKKRWKFSRLGFISSLVFLTILVMVLTYAIIVISPLKESIPGYPDKEARGAIIQNAIRLDSLEEEIKIRDQYLGNLKKVLLGEQDFDENFESQSSKNKNAPGFMLPEIPEYNRHDTVKNAINSILDEPLSSSNVHFFPPVNGVVTNSFDPVNDHFGTDIVSPDNEIVSASMDGTIILANWTIETGYTVEIQHAEGFITVYRHLKKLLCNTGAFVNAGDPIGIYGNTGEISFGPHLHFEIWHQGTPLNPEKVVRF